VLAKVLWYHVKIKYKEKTERRTRGEQETEERKKKRQGNRRRHLYWFCYFFNYKSEQYIGSLRGAHPVNHAVKYGGKHENNEEEIRDEILQVNAVKRLRRI
jgi:hypothetical protein